MDMNQETKVTGLSLTTGRVRRKLKLCAAGSLPAPGLSLLLLRCLEQWR